jgi:hypothetical protein
VKRAGIGFVALLAVLCAAPTVGDVGSCGQTADPLGAPEFFRARADVECTRCADCGYDTRPCRRACEIARGGEVPRAFPEGCQPVVHDGEVCLNAIEALSCGRVGDLVSEAPIVPTECDFCPPIEEAR